MSDVGPQGDATESLRGVRRDARDVPELPGAVRNKFFLLVTAVFQRSCELHAPVVLSVNPHELVYRDRPSPDKSPKSLTRPCC